MPTFLTRFGRLWALPAPFTEGLFFDYRLSAWDPSSQCLTFHPPRGTGGGLHPWKNRSVASAFYPWSSLNACGRREARSTWWYVWYCLPDSNLYISRNPETSSRVTLASLGIGFQPKLNTWIIINKQKTKIIRIIKSPTPFLDRSGGLAFML
mgnify:CR=1 FL=1